MTSLDVVVSEYSKTLLDLSARLANAALDAHTKAARIEELEKQLAELRNPRAPAP